MKSKISLLTVAMSCLLMGKAMALDPRPFKVADVLSLSTTKGNMNEFCTEFPIGDYIVSISRPLTTVEFNVHRHLDNKIIYPLRENVNDALSRRFTVEQAGEYCLMLINQKAAPQDYHVEVIVTQSTTKQHDAGVEL